MTTRRDFLRYGFYSISSAGLYGLGIQKAFTSSPKSIHYTPTHFMSAVSDYAGNQYIAVFNQLGSVMFQHDSAYRAHSFAINRKHSLLYSISRRPGNLLDVFDVAGNLHNQISADDNRHFYGHGQCSYDDRFLYTTENNLQNYQGIVSCRTASSDPQVLREFPSYGIGPHDIQLSPDQQYLIVANGGVKTHPRTGRKKLNIPSMQPSLAFIDSKNGNLLRQISLDKKYRFNSIRHLAVAANGNVFIALQNQVAEKNNEVLLAHYDFKKHTLNPIHIPPLVQTQLKGYLGDIAIDASEQFFASTSPKGGYILFYNIDGQYLNSQAIKDSSGIHAGTNPGEFWVTNGEGKIILFQITPKGQLFSFPINHLVHLRWDNHLIQL